MFSRRILIENIASLAVLQFLNYAAPLITLPYLARVLNPSQFGLLAYTQGILLYFDLFTDFGFNFSATRAISSLRNDRIAVARIFWSTLAAKLLLMTISGFCVVALIFAVPNLRSMAALLMVNYLYVIGTAFFPVWYFQGLERLKLAALYVGLGRLLTVPALLLFVKSSDDIVIAGAIQASVELTASILSAPAVYGRLGPGWYRPRWHDIAARLKEGWPLFLSASALQITSSSATVMLGGLSDTTQIAYYSAADKLIKAVSSALNPIGQALYPRISAIQAFSTDKAFAVIRKSLRVMSLLAIALSATTYFVAQPFCHVFLGQRFAQSVTVLQTLAPLPFLMGLINVLGLQTMLVFGMDYMFFRIVAGSVVVGLPLTALLAWKLGAVGAAFANCITSAIIVAAILFVLLSRQFPIWMSRPTANGRSTATVARTNV
jgi:polysaccharide transporter, PST family